jgi:hypothetical protein
VTAPYDLANAFDAAAGRRSPKGIPPALAAYAHRVVAVGRRVEAQERCPRAVLARAEALCQAPRRRRAAVLLRLLADSWTALPAAARGGHDRRFLRFGSSSGNLDVELTPSAGGGYSLRGLVEVDGGGLSVEMVTRSRRARRVPVASSGAFNAEVGPEDLPLSLTVVSGGSALLRTGLIPPGRG